MDENPKTTLNNAEAVADMSVPGGSAAPAVGEAPAAGEGPAPAELLHADAAQAGGAPAPVEIATIPAAAEIEANGRSGAAPSRSAGRAAGAATSRARDRRAAAWPMYALAFSLAIGVFLAAVSLYLSSTSGKRETAAIENVQKSLGRMEEQIADEEKSRVKRAISPSEMPSGARLLEAANARYREGRFQDAVSDFRAAVAADSAIVFSDEAHYRFGISLLKTDDSPDALREFQAVVVGSPGSVRFASSAMESARLFREKKNYPQARRMLYQLLAARDRLSAADKDDVEQAYFLIGKCLEDEAAALEATSLPAQLLPHSGPGDSSPAAAPSAVAVAADLPGAGSRAPGERQ